MTADTNDRILRIGTVLDRTGLTRSTLYRKIQNGTFPKQVRISMGVRQLLERAMDTHLAVIQSLETDLADEEQQEQKALAGADAPLMLTDAGAVAADEEVAIEEDGGVAEDEAGPDAAPAE